MRTSRGRHTPAVLAVVLAGGLALTGCTATSNAKTTDADADGAGQDVRLQISPAAESTGVRPDAPVRVAAKGGELTSVRVTTADGESVEGSREQGGWTSEERLAPDTDYVVRAVATGPGGKRTTRKSTFSTLEPKERARYDIVYNGWTVGVAMPVSIQFEEPVAKEYRKEIEQAVSVTSSTEAKGSWGWLDDRQLMWRPKEYWEPGTKVQINAPLQGFQTAPGTWVEESSTGSMTIGRQQFSEVDIPAHEMHVTRGGQTIKTFPVSSGRPGKETETRSGLKVVIGKQREMTMDSETVGIEKGEPGYYKVETDYNVRVTWTGEFVHSAPWSVGAQGSENVSHGCVNMAPQNAEWFYENSIPGDPVNFTGSDREFQPTEGIGVWQYDWQEWQGQSALR